MSSPRRATWLAVGATVVTLAFAASGCTSDSTTDTQRDSDTFYFQDTDLTTSRQGGNVIDVFIGVRYVEGMTADQIPDYRRLQDLAQTFVAPTEALPAKVSWETIAREMAPAIMAAGPISGATVQIRVHPKCAEPIDERGIWRSAIYTVGDIEPMEYVAGPLPACPTQ